MFVSDNFLVDYAGYEIIISSSLLGNTAEGRGIFTSTKLNSLICVFGDQVFEIMITYNQQSDQPLVEKITNIGSLATATGVVYITENNKPQILISDNVNLYIYDTTISRTVQTVPDLNFVPGYITFHNTYFLCSASQDDTYSPPANNTWRLSLQNQGYTADNTPSGTTAWPDTSQYVGLLQTKPDNTQAVVRFPAKGNMIFVMGSVVTESWFFTGTQLFPYQRNNQFTIDYGCLSPASVAYMDEVVVWLAQNEKSGPIIMYSDGGMAKKITTDGIDFLFSELQNPQNSQGFLYRQDGHLFYHINFYSDNLSLFYDFNTEKFYNASDQNLNYFIAAEIAFLGNQYYFVSRNSGNLYAFDTSFTTYQDVPTPTSTTPQNYIIPRIRTCQNVRLPSQDYFIANDVGFTIESGETNYYQQTGVGGLGDSNAMYLLNGTPMQLLSGGNFNLITVSNPMNPMLITTPQVFLSVSYDGGASFGSEWPYVLPGIGYRRNRLMWWQLGICNDLVCQFRFVGIGRFVCTEGVINIRV